MDEVGRAIRELRMGRCVLLYDNDERERETDIVYASQFVSWQSIKHMRKNGGGLICTTVPYSAQKILDLPYLVDVLQKTSAEYPLLSYLFPHDIPYDSKSSFSITINHRKTFTGITDRDRALTIKRFSDFVDMAIKGDDRIKEKFGKEFRSPGHVFLLNADRDLLDSREGHTELSTALVEMAGLIPTATICEMMGDDGSSLSKRDAKAYAEKNNLAFLEGRDIVKAWKEHRKIKIESKEADVMTEG